MSAGQVHLMAVKAMSGSGSGSYENVARGIIYAADRGAQILNLSFGSTADAPLIATAVQYARDRGSLQRRLRSKLWRSVGIVVHAKQLCKRG